MIYDISWYRVAQIVASLHPGWEKMEREWENGEEMERELENEEEMEREWGENEKMKRKWREIHSLHFLIFSLFPPSLTLSYINKPLLLQMSQKTQHTRNEKIILGRIRCEKAPQVVPACQDTYYKHAPDHHMIYNISMPLICVLAVHHPLLSNRAIISFTVNRRKKCLRPYVNCLLC